MSKTDEEIDDQEEIKRFFRCLRVGDHPTVRWIKEIEQRFDCLMSACLPELPEGVDIVAINATHFRGVPKGYRAAIWHRPQYKEGQHYAGEGSTIRAACEAAIAKIGEHEG